MKRSDLIKELDKVLDFWAESNYRPKAADIIDFLEKHTRRPDASRIIDLRSKKFHERLDEIKKHK